MLSIQIDDKKIEETLISQFSTPEKIKQYLYELVVEDLEDKRFAGLLEEGRKQDYVSKEDVFDILKNV